MPIKVITFDLDNTLWDVEPVIIRAEQAQYQWLKIHRPRVNKQLTLENLRDFKNDFYRQNPRLHHQISELRIASLTAIQISVGYSPKEAEVGAVLAFEQFMALRHQVEFYEQALDILEELDQNYTLGALTNGNADIHKMDAGGYFDFSYSAEQVNASKPHPAMFEAALKTCNVEADEVIHVGDNPEHDVFGAQQVGMHCIWMNSDNVVWPGGQPADEEINQLCELPKAINRIDRRNS